MKKHPFPILLLLTVVGILSISCNMTSAIFATPTPTITNTPTITPSPTPTNTPTPAPTLTPLPSGIRINKMPDEGTEFIDYDGRYKLTVPAGWTAIPLEKETIDESLSLATEQNTQLEAIIDYLHSVDESIYRVFFFDFRSEYADGKLISNINVIYQKDELVSSMPLDFIVSSTEESLPAMLPGAEVLSTNISTLSSGIEVGELDITQNTMAFDGTEVSMYQKIIIFKTEDGMVNITFSLPIKQRDTLQPEIDQVIASIALLSP
jgi:hypothetical protein